MEPKEPEELIVISDLHLSDGCNAETRKYSRNEDFFFDEEFKRFLEHLQKQKSSKKHLIIAGDMFDFLQVTPDLKKFNDYPQVEELTEADITKRDKKYGFGTEEKKTVWKLNVIATGHKGFFKALANFLAKGNRLSIITGNHDIELYWGEVQREFKKLIVASKPRGVTKKQIRDSISFYPWFYYDDKFKAYIEHGNQYDTFNSFEYFLYPRLKLESKKLWIPFGSFFVRYLFNKLETSNPFADNIKPSTKYMRWVWEDDKLQFLKTIFLYLPTMVRVYKKSGNFSKTAKGRLEGENAKELAKLAKLQRVPEHTLTEIYNLKASPFTCHKILNILTFSSGFFFVTAVIVSIVHLAALALLPEFSYWNALYSLLLLVLPIVRWLSKILHKEPFRKIIVNVLKWITEHLKNPVSKWLLEFFQKDPFEKARQIKRHLKDAKIDVQTIVFGHTHNPDTRPDMRDVGIVDEEFRYFNTGTWTTVFSEEERIIREAKQFTFVRIKEKGMPRATLSQWNDCLELRENLILFESKPPEIGLIIRIIRAIYSSCVRLITSSPAKQKKAGQSSKETKAEEPNKVI